MISLNEILKKLSKDGKDFEKLTKWYLENNPKYKKIFKKIWHFKNFPKRWGKDTGTDLIAETHDNEYWAIQSKNYNKKYYISKEDINSFLSDTNRKLISRRLLIATTNNIGKNGFKTIRDQEKPVHLELLDNLENAEVNWPKKISKLYPSKTKPHEPWPWQKKALNQITDGLKKYGKGKVIMACGSGKTEMGIWINEKFKSKKTLVLVPTIYLMTQTIERWCAHSKIKFNFLAVCSDKTVVNKDSLIKSISETTIPSTTDSEKISSFLKRNETTVVFSTYDSLPAVIAGLNIGSIKLDFVIADEAHRTASISGSKFSLVHNHNLVPRKRIVYMTATPRIQSTHLKAKAKASDIYLFSMDDEIYGKTLFKLSFSDAVKKGILTDYRIFVIGYESKEYQKFINNRSFLKFKKKIKSDAKSLALKFSLIKSFKKYNTKKILSFHTRIKSAKTFANEFKNLNEIGYLKSKGINDFWTSWIEGGMSSFDKKNLISQFKENSNKIFSLLTNAKCLTEGIDVPKIDTICFLDPKQSQVDIAQAVGRVMRKVKGKSMGNLIIPIPITNKENIEESLYKSQYREIFAVTNAMKDHDDELKEILEEYKKGLGKKTSNKKTLGKIVLDLPENVTENFYQELKLRIVDRTTSLSKTMISLIADYKKKYNHLKFSKKDKKPFDKLFSWVDLMRSQYRQNKIPLWIKNDLEAIKGFSWRVEGQTLDDVKDLLPESIFAKKVKYSQIRKLREAKLIEPRGFYPTMGKGDQSQKFEKRVSAYYSIDQKKDLEKIGLIDIDKEKFILKEEALKIPGITLKLFKSKKLKSVFRGIHRGGQAYYYDKKLINKIAKTNVKKLKIPGTNLIIPTQQTELKEFLEKKGYCTENKAKEILDGFPDENIVKPVHVVENFVKIFNLSDVKNYKKVKDEQQKLLSTHLTEADVRNKIGLKNIQNYRKKNLIKPDAEYFPNSKFKKDGKAKPLYLKKTIDNFLIKNGVNITNVDKYYHLIDLINKTKYTNMKKLIKHGLIKIAGIAISNGGFTEMFDKKNLDKAVEVIKLAKKLGFMRGKKIYIKEKQFKVLKDNLINNKVI